MTRRIISSQAAASRDGDLTPELHKALTDRLGRVMEEDGSKAFYADIMKLVAASANSDDPIGKVVQDYLNKLPEPQRTMFIQRRKGMSPTQIAKTMGMQAQPVCRALAKIYADLRRLFN